MIMLKGNTFDAATAVRKAIALLRQAIGSSLGEEEITGTQIKLESNGVTRLGCVSNLSVVVSSADLLQMQVDLDCVHAKDELHFHRVHVVQDRYEADQSSLYTNPSRA
ncbi:hypothetical protein Tco_0357410 [Tanacetum coccineum]